MADFIAKSGFSFFFRTLKVVPVVGSFYVLARGGKVLREKGKILGSIDILLDMLPVISVIKVVIESFTGDLIPAKDQVRKVHPVLEPAL